MANTQQINDFIDLIAPVVIMHCKNHGWGIPSAIIAQAGIESAWGTSGLWLTCFNGWGMKWKDGCGCDYKEYSTKEQKPDGSYYTVIARFRRYPDIMSGIDGYFKFIESYKRYDPVKRANNYSSYAVQLKACGWATSLNYATNIIKTVDSHNLTRFDSANPTEYEIGKTYTLSSNMYIRISPAGDKIDYYSITSNAQLNAYTDDDGFSILKSGTRVTCRDYKTIGDEIWMQIPSGWVCAKKGEKVYIA